LPFLPTDTYPRFRGKVRFTPPGGLPLPAAATPTAKSIRKDRTTSNRLPSSLNTLPFSGSHGRPRDLRSAKNRAGTYPIMAAYLR